MTNINYYFICNLIYPSRVIYMIQYFQLSNLQCKGIFEDFIRLIDN